MKKKTRGRSAAPPKIPPGRTPIDAREQRARQQLKRLRTTSTPMPHNMQVSFLCRRTGLTPDEVNAVLDAQFEMVCAHLARSGPGRISILQGLRLFTQKSGGRRRRWSIHPQTGERVQMPAVRAQWRLKARATRSIREQISVKA